MNHLGAGKIIIAIITTMHQKILKYFHGSEYAFQRTFTSIPSHLIIMTTSGGTKGGYYYYYFTHEDPEPWRM